MTGWSLRRRLTLAVVGLVAVVLGGLALVVAPAVERAAWRQFDGGLAQQARAWSALVEHDEDGYEMELPPAADDARATYVEVWCPGDTVLARSTSLGGSDLPRPSIADASAVTLTLPDGRRGRAWAHRFMPRLEDDTPATPCTLVFAEGTEDVVRAVASARGWFVVMSALALVVAGLMAVLLVDRGLRPLTRLTAQLAAIDRDSLGSRIELRSVPHELAAPVATLNELLARLEASFARERQFTADVSHELRTPLAGLRATLEVAELTADSAEAYRRSIAAALAVTSDLSALVTNLLALHRAEDGALTVTRAPLTLAEFIDTTWAPHAETARRRQVRFHNRLADDVVVTTDRTLAAVVVGNLLANAAEYTEAGGWIEVRGDHRRLEIVDSGPPIPAEHLARLFDRLWRGDPTRTATGAHHGIGLALARSLATRLGWTVTAAERDDQTVVFAIELGDAAITRSEGDAR